MREDGVSLIESEKGRREKDGNERTSREEMMSYLSRRNAIVWEKNRTRS
jgi:hypothetical protein